MPPGRSGSLGTPPSWSRCRARTLRVAGGGRCWARGAAPGRAHSHGPPPGRARGCRGQAHLLAGGDGGGGGAGRTGARGAVGRPRAARRVAVSSHIVDLTGQGGHVLHQRLAQPAAAGGKTGPAGSSWARSQCREVWGQEPDGTRRHPPPQAETPLPPAQVGWESLPGGSHWVRSRARGTQPPAWPKLHPASHQQQCQGDSHWAPQCPNP